MSIETDQLIKIQTAILAMKKGFPQNYYPFYKENGNIIVHSFGVPVGLKYYAATQTSLQKWLREEYHQHISIWLNHDCCFRVDFTTIGPFEAMERGLNKNFDIYEDALEAGLFCLLTKIDND